MVHIWFCKINVNLILFLKKRETFEDKSIYKDRITEISLHVVSG